MAGAEVPRVMGATPVINILRPGLTKSPVIVNIWNVIDGEANHVGL